MSEGVSKSESDILLQVSVDENAFTQFFNVFTSSDQLIGLRFLMRESTKLKHAFLDKVNQYFTTSLVSKFIPSITDEFGKGKKMDAMFTFSHNRFLKGFPDAKRSTVLIDKNGNMKVSMNFQVWLNVEMRPEVFVKAR